MKLATVVGPRQLEFADAGDGIFMCVAQYAQVDQEYHSYYKEKAAQGNIVILDNGAAEGGAMSLDALLQLQELIKPTVWVVPDVVCDGAATLWNFYYACWSGDIVHPVMVVPQGRSVSEWRCCAGNLKRNLWPQDWIGVSKFVTRYTGRWSLMDYASPGGWTWHLLGLTNPEDLPNHVKDHPWIASVDTSLPIAMGMRGYDIRNFEYSGKIEAMLDARVPDVYKDLVWDNIQDLREMAHGKYST